MNVAIYYHPEAYTTEATNVMGRNAAGESFLRGFLTHSHATEFWVQGYHHAHANHFEGVARSFGRHEPVHSVHKNSLGTLANAGVVYYPGPGIGEHARHRAAHGHHGWSLCGITHTTSSANAMDAIVDLIAGPVQPWDAVICTSNAVKANVSSLLQVQADYLQNRLGITKLVVPQLPVIPLGIHTDDFVFSADQKVAARARLQVADNTLVVLFMGRLSFHAKAHPLAMYQALQAAVVETGKDVVLLECGWHANEHIQKAFAEAACVACPGVRVITLDGRKPEDRLTAWAAADIFCSLADNIQETFGIVPLEAMAASLPVVVSDWDGYKDTVRDSVDGFRIPTLMPQAGLAGDLALRHALEVDTYDMYCGYTCSLVAVDVQAATGAFVQLFQSANLRKKMGEAGQQRARELYDWAVIITQYEALWAHLNDIRIAAPNTTSSLAHPWPARMDPLHAFAGYPTQALTSQTVLRLVDASAFDALKRVSDYRRLAMIDFAALILPGEDEVEIVLNAAAAGPTSALQLVANIADARRPFVFRSLAWLVKLNVLKVSV